MVKVPNLEGMTLDAAKAMIESKDLTWNIEYQHSEQAKDIVIDQSIQPETEVDSKTEITLYVSDGTPPTKSISVNFTLPSNANGTFTFQIFIDGSLATQKTVDASTIYGSTKIALDGNGTQLVVVKIKNDGNGKTAEYGRYNINFDDGGSIEVISQKIEQAFVEIDGLLIVTEPIYTQPEVSQPEQTDSIAQELQPQQPIDTQVEETQAPIDTQASSEDTANVVQ